MHICLPATVGSGEQNCKATQDEIRVIRLRLLPWAGEYLLSGSARHLTSGA